MHCEFSLHHYREILEANPSAFGRAKDRKQILLVHDIDLFPPYALTMAKLEHTLGINSTYFILQHSEFYNAMSPENMQIWKQIREMGHELGLHYNGEYSPDLSVAHFAFARMFDSDSVELALHLNGITPQPEIPRYLHDRRAFNKEGYGYIADSGGWWRNGCMCQHLNEKTICLIHPVWWLIGTKSLDQLESDAKAVIERARHKWDILVKNHRDAGGFKG